MPKILIKNGRVWDGEKFYFADVLADNGKISKIGEIIDEPVNSATDFVFDAKDKIVSAGFVDLHMHMRGVSSVTFGTQGEMSCFPFGVTAAVDGAGSYGDKALLDSFMLKNLVFVFAEFKDNKADFIHAEKMLEKYGDKCVGIKVFFDSKDAEVRDIKPLCECIEFAQQRNLIVMVHSSNAPIPMAELLGVLRKGDIFTHAYHGGKNNVSEDDFECIKIAKKRGIIIDVGMAGHVHTDFKVFENAISKGALPDTISTDITRWSAYKRGGRYGMTMCMSIAKFLGMKEEKIFKAVTSAPSEVFGKENEWGYLKVGRCADIAVLDYSGEGFELIDVSGNCISDNVGYKCVLTVADGEVVYKV